MESEPCGRSPEVDVHLETEWQFEAVDLDALRPPLPEIAGACGLALDPPSIRGIRDLYLDTRDWRIYRCGYALRIRETGGRREATLKALVRNEEGPAVRQEITQILSRQDCGLPPTGSVGRRIRVLCRPRALRTIAEIHTTREAYAIRAGEEAAGELVLDATLLRDPRGGVHALQRVEIEVETPRSDDVALFVDRVRSAGSLQRAALSKFEWALSVLGHFPRRAFSFGPTEVSPRMNVVEAAFAVLRKRFSSMQWHEPGTRLGEDPEHLHDMRVATRRIRAALRLFPGVLPARETVQLRGDLRTLGQALGKVRDLDVHIGQIESWKKTLTSVEPTAADPIIRSLERERDARRAELLSLLDSRWYGGLKASISARLRAAPSPCSHTASSPIRAEGPRIIRRARRRVIRLGRRLDSSSAAEDLHRLRIRCKRLRYAIEFVEPLYGPPAREMILALVTLQDMLGLHQDAVVSIASLKALAREQAGGLTPESKSASCELIDLYSARMASVRIQFPAAFARIRGRIWKDLNRAMNPEGGKVLPARGGPGTPGSASVPRRNRD